jgi:glyoxylase-like metal-dependent hydrolase (beta-lactamase superfamily II)
MLRQRASCGKEADMQWLDLDGIRIAALTDATPTSASCQHSFPDADLSGRPDLSTRWLEGGVFRTRFGMFLLRRSEGDILVDCGMGPGPVAYFPGLHGDLPDQLARAGSAPDRIATAIFTHLHLDHVGWAPHLPNAGFVVAEAEWAHWSRGEKAGLPHHVEAVASCVSPLAQAGRLRLATSDTEIAPGIVLLAAKGHTPGHHAVLIQDRLLIAGDLWHNPAQIAEPQWCHRADQDKPAAIASRIRLAEAAHRNGWLVAAGHFTEDAVFGHIAATGNGLAWAPLSA